MTATVEDLRNLESMLKRLSPDEIAEIASMPGVKEELERPWQPNPGPQTLAFKSEADELLFGGEAGGGKSDVLIGIAYNKHKKSRILRRINQDAEELGERLVEILGSDDGYTRKPPQWRGGDDQFIEFRGCELDRDKQRYKGKARDFIGYDELADFTESQFVFINTWNRSADPNQRCRIVGATNGPTTAEGAWIIRRWGPWLDPTHPNPAQDGELRYFLTIDGQEEEVDGPGPHEVRGRMVKATSRTFIRSRLENNPDLDETDYGDRLESLPDELRKVYRDGDFTIGLRDENWQVIPTRWITAAQERWTEGGWQNAEMTAMALDCAGGGADAAVLAYRHWGWFGPLESVTGEETADGAAMAALIFRHRRSQAPIVVDAGGGYAGGVIERLKDNNIEPNRFNAAGASIGTAIGSGLRFVNMRAESIWRTMEALDPDQEGGSQVAIPPDPQLRSDLASYRYKNTPRGIQVEGKEDIRKRIGRSPDKGDAVVMCLSEGSKAVLRNMDPRTGRMGTGRGRMPQAVLGHAKAKSHYGRR